jgi:hypothetical protein
MYYANINGLFDDDSLFKQFEDFLRAKMSDEKAVDDALAHLQLIFLRQRSVQFGIQATLQYMIEHGKLRRESHPRDEICLVPDPNQRTRSSDPSH